MSQIYIHRRGRTSKSVTREVDFAPRLEHAVRDPYELVALRQRNDRSAPPHLPRCHAGQRAETASEQRERGARERDSEAIRARLRAFFEDRGRRPRLADVPALHRHAGRCADTDVIRRREARP